MLPIAEPAEIGLCSDQLERAYRMLAQWADENKVPGSALAVGRHGHLVPIQFFGKLKPTSISPAMPDNAIFLIASITKPVTCTGIMILVERGELLLSDRVTHFIPEFGKNGKNSVKIRHLMTHTSGLPDMLPENQELRKDHQPLSEFTKRICDLELDFPPGQAVQYQSTGMAILSEVIKRITQQQLRDFLQKELFHPLNMRDTALGVPPSWYDASLNKTKRIAHIRTGDDEKNTDWHWNSNYWWQFGAPWGGLMTTPADLAIFFQLMRNKGSYQNTRLLSPATVHAMTHNQLQGMPDIQKLSHKNQPWGLGWRLHWPAHSANFGDLLSESTFGHWGATGTVGWVDPEHSSFMILFTTEPQEPHGRYLSLISNIVASARM